MVLIEIESGGLILLARVAPSDPDGGTMASVTVALLELRTICSSVMTSSGARNSSASVRRSRTNWRTMRPARAITRMNDMATPLSLATRSAGQNTGTPARSHPGQTVGELLRAYRRQAACQIATI